MRQIINGKAVTLGTCYYPEHWPQELWREDLLRMKEVGIEVIRIAEFAWSKIELHEGEFDYSFFDSFLDLAEEVGMKVIFCTPTATPPAWLTHKYPEVLNANMQGNLYCHGARRHYNYNSPVYREKAAIITEKSAEHYGNRKCIIGWQLDNEFNCENSEFYSESDSKAFRVFLQKKYGDLDTLNEAWGTVFWNQTYTDWEEVDVPRMTNSNSTNPHRVLDYKRFVSESVCSFAKLQSDILRKYIKEEDFITTNGVFGNINYQRLNSESLDFMTYDSYPNFAYCLSDYNENDKLKDRKWSRNLTEIRAISDNFGIMEQQSGANGWNTHMEAPTPRPGQLTLWTMQSIAHGADFISYFRWRTATMGTELYWHGILDYSGRENRRLREVREVYGKLQNMKGLAGTKYHAEVAVLKDYDNVWDADTDVWHG
ncbi:MAG: beta-galactosidase, partial [Lachnospiraceae bacterium]|nr:beta-galactosidase [Lachnospiraceae bacterium]